MQKDLNVTNLVAESIDSVPYKGKDEIHLSTGVVLKANRVSTMLFNEITKKISRPKPPMFVNQDTGRKEENLSDPQYIDELELYNQNISTAVIDTMILMGTKLISIPDGFPKVEDESWVDDLELIGVTFNKNSNRARYLFWIKCIACPFDTDIVDITNIVGRLSGVSEEDVSTAVDKFRSDTK